MIKPDIILEVKPINNLIIQFSDDRFVKLNKDTTWYVCGTIGCDDSSKVLVQRDLSSYQIEGIPIDDFVQLFEAEGVDQSELQEYILDKYKEESEYE